MAIVTWVYPWAFFAQLFFACILAGVIKILFFVKARNIYRLLLIGGIISHLVGFALAVTVYHAKFITVAWSKDVEFMILALPIYAIVAGEVLMVIILMDRRKHNFLRLFKKD